MREPYFSVGEEVIILYDDSPKEGTIADFKTGEALYGFLKSGLPQKHYHDKNYYLVAEDDCWYVEKVLRKKYKPSQFSFEDLVKLGSNEEVTEE